MSIFPCTWLYNIVVAPYGSTTGEKAYTLIGTRLETNTSKQIGYGNVLPLF